jgi:hypothetical protein
MSKVERHWPAMLLLPRAVGNLEPVRDRRRGLALRVDDVIEDAFMDTLFGCDHEPLLESRGAI